jgi:hypothetical protein
MARMIHRRWRVLLTLIMAGVQFLVGVNYYLAKPTLLAHQFADAIARGEYVRAESLFISRTSRAPPGKNEAFPGGVIIGGRLKGTVITISSTRISQMTLLPAARDLR